MKTLEELGISPAPWKTEVNDCDKRLIASDITGLWLNNSYEPLRPDSDARLIAAAPELYEALRTILDTLDGYGFQPILDGDPLAVAVKRGQYAIKKAGGEE